VCLTCCWTMHSVLLQKSCFQLLLLRHWHFTRWCSDTFQVWWDLRDSIITNFLLILCEKNVRKLSIFDEVIRRTKKCANFFGPPCILCWVGGILTSHTLVCIQLDSHNVKDAVPLLIMNGVWSSTLPQLWTKRLLGKLLTKCSVSIWWMFNGVASNNIFWPSQCILNCLWTVRSQLS